MSAFLQVKKWLTINEPWSFVHHGYSTGMHAPGRCSDRRVMAIALAPGRAERCTVLRKCPKGTWGGGRALTKEDTRKDGA